MALDRTYKLDSKHEMWRVAMANMRFGALQWQLEALRREGREEREGREGRGTRRKRCGANRVEGLRKKNCLVGFNFREAAVVQTVRINFALFVLTYGRLQESRAYTLGSMECLCGIVESTIESGESLWVNSRIAPMPTLRSQHRRR